MLRYSSSWPLFLIFQSRNIACHPIRGDKSLKIFGMFRRQSPRDETVNFSGPARKPPAFCAAAPSAHEFGCVEAEISFRNTPNQKLLPRIPFATK